MYGLSRQAVDAQRSANRGHPARRPADVVDDGVMVLLAGATGFLGREVLARLVADGYAVTCLVRKSSDLSHIRQYGAGHVAGDLKDPKTLTRALSGHDALIHLPSLGFGHTAGIVQACIDAGVTRSVFVSTTGIYTNLAPRTKQTRLEAENLIRDSGLDYTIIRPTMIYGHPGDNNMARLVDYVSANRLVPILGTGKSLQQPVYVGDVAAAVVRAYERPVASGRVYTVSGRDPLSYNDVVDTVATALDRRVRKVHIPLSLSVSLLHRYEKLVRRPKLKAEQAQRLNENKEFSHEAAARDLDFTPMAFREGIERQIAER